jgi:hypothetical protein
MPGPHINQLYEALGSQHGVAVLTSDPVKARQRFYALRKEANDPDLESLSIVQSPTNPLELWIIKRSPK